MFEHLLHGLRYHLRVLVAVVAQRILSNPPPNQGLGLGVVEVDNHGSYHVLLWSDSAHSAADSAHAPCLVGGLLFHAAACGEDDVRVLRFLHQLQTLPLHGIVDVRFGLLRQYRVLDLVGIVSSPGVGVILRKTLALVVID